MLVVVFLGKALRKCTRGYGHWMHAVWFLRKSNLSVSIWEYDTLMSSPWRSSGLAAAAIFLSPPLATPAPHQGQLGLRAAPLAPVPQLLSSGTWGLWLTAVYSEALRGG